MSSRMGARALRAFSLKTVRFAMRVRYFASDTAIV
jgi:hypothetical protein